MNDHTSTNQETGFEIAVIGMACRFPGAESIVEYWQNLKNGVESVSFFSDEELLSQGIDHKLLKDPNYVKAGAILKEVALFDAAFFGYSPREAETMDPQHRLFLECASEALEDAGYNPEFYHGLIGVFAGTGINRYLFNIYPDGVVAESAADFQSMLGNDKDFLCTRVSYKLDLKGPSITVQSACSSSMVAVHTACQSLLSGDADMALAGGVSIKIPQRSGHLYQEGWIASPDGHCRTFDAAARGTIQGSGAGILLLKRWKDALADGDNIYALIKGSAINNDGAHKIGYTAPQAEGQARVIRAAQLMAEVDAATISYVEAHGTGTELGDPIEIAGLTKAFRLSTEQCNFCAIGSVKTNIGHLDAAAGVASLIKTILALSNKMLPPSLHFKEPNPKIDFASSPFYVNTSLRSWHTDNSPLRAGVSSFGIGGTNAHVVLEEALAPVETTDTKPWKLLVLSAKTPAALKAMTSRIVHYLRTHPGVNFDDLTYTLQVGRKQYAHRLALVCQNTADAITIAENQDRLSDLVNKEKVTDRLVVFLFPGQGSQYVNMGWQLYQSETVFREQIDRCSTLLTPHLGFEVREIIYPVLSQHGSSSINLDQTKYAQPALFVIEYALARLVMSWGITPGAMLGHSIGEFVAACLADVFSLEDALAIIAARANMMQSLPSGAMLAVHLPAAELQPFLGTELSLAAINGPAICVASGTHEAIEKLKAQLTEQKIACQFLKTSHAFHSAAVDPILASFKSFLKKITLHPNKIPFLSNVTGTWIQPGEAAGVDYWTEHMRHTVRFTECMDQLSSEEDCVILEIGPGNTLTNLVKKYPAFKDKSLIFSPMRQEKQAVHDLHSLLTMLSNCWLAGVKINWPGLYPGQRHHRLSLPTYPFERKRFWINARQRNPSNGSPVLQEDKKRPVSEWFYTPSWKETELPVIDMPASLQQHSWLIFHDHYRVGDGMVHQLRSAGAKVIEVRQGDRFQKTGEDSYTIQAGDPNDYHLLLSAIGLPIDPPLLIAHLWGIGTHEIHASPYGSLEQAQTLGFFSLLYLIQAIGKQKAGTGLRIGVVTSNMQKLKEDDISFPEKSTVLGAIKIIPKEYPGITCDSIDLSFPLPGPANDPDPSMIDQLFAELLHPSSNPVIAYRNGRRRVQVYEEAGLFNPSTKKLIIKEQGVYLITGGLGGVGLTLSAYLARTFKAKLILLNRSSLPAREEWDQWLIQHDDHNKISQQILAVQQLETLGSEVMLASADISEEAQVQEILERSLARFHHIDGVIHAAGIAGGGMARLRTFEKAMEVLLPKVKGTLVLHKLFKDQKLDFMLLCSSLSAVLGEFGQIDYCAANSFLDAFAGCHHAPNGPLIISVNWDRWKETGMAAEAAAAIQVKNETPGAVIDHPLIDQCLFKQANEAVYLTDMGYDTHWVLAEHQFNDKAILPGTAYIEMVRAAAAHFVPEKERVLIIREIYFGTPLMIGQREKKEVRIVITRKNDSLDFVITSQLPADQKNEGTLQEHARGKIIYGDLSLPAQHDLASIRQSCAHPVQTDDQSNTSGPFRFGPRWKELVKEITIEQQGGLALLELPEIFREDLAQYYLHPALLDMATGFATVGRGEFLPFSYSNIRLYGPMPRTLYSYIRRQQKTVTDGHQNFAVTIMDTEGKTILDIEDFLLKKPDHPRPIVTGNASDISNYHLKIAKPGLLDSLYMEAGKRRQPGVGEVEIEVYTVGLNFKDVLLALHTNASGENAGEINFGRECTGRIVAVGGGVENFQWGDEVIAMSAPCFSNYLTTPASQVVPKPSHISFEEAAGIAVSYLTAHYSLNHLARLKKGERILIHAAAGGVGLAAITIAQQTGAEIYATAGSHEKQDYLRSIGIKHIMSSRNMEFAGKIMEYTNGNGVDVVLNSLSGEFMLSSLSLLAPSGRFLEIGKRDIQQNTPLPLKAFEKGLSFFAIDIGPDMPGFGQALNEVVQAFRQNTWRLLPCKVFPVDQVAEAFDYMAKARQIGKVVIVMKEAKPGEGMIKNNGIAAFLNTDAGILNEEAIEVFRLVLENNWPQVIVSTRPLAKRMEEQLSIHHSLMTETFKNAGVYQGQKHARPALTNEFVAPRNEMEEILAAIWQEVLNIDKVGIHDNFFDLGGASLQSIQIAANAKEKNVPVNPELLFECQTIAEVTENITQGKEQE